MFNLPSHIVLCRLTQVRWTRYNPSFVEPEVNKELYRKPWDELSEEEKEKQELRALQPIKAAPPSVSCSVFSDPMIRSEKALSLTARSHGIRMSGSCAVLLSLYLLWCMLPSLTAQFLWVNLFPQSQSTDWQWLEMIQAALVAPRFKHGKNTRGVRTPYLCRWWNKNLNQITLDFVFTANSPIWWWRMEIKCWPEALWLRWELVLLLTSRLKQYGTKGWDIRPATIRNYLN